MPLSTNSVFHFTSSIDSIKSILTSKFKIKYCLETIECKDRIIKFAVPMVSFCDIPLSQVQSHVNKYGGYGIGLVKGWAKRRGLNPVLYLEKHSMVLNEVLIREKFENSENRAVQGFLKYTKNYEGQLIRNGQIINKVYRFFDEREWRFSPAQEQLRDHQQIIHDIEYYNELKNRINEDISGIGLTFNFKDISYIIIKDDNELIEIVNYLDSSLTRPQDRDYIKILISKIITTKQIKSDF